MLACQSLFLFADTSNFFFFFLKTVQNIRGGIEYRKNNPYLKVCNWAWLLFVSLISFFFFCSFIQLAHDQKDYPLEQEVCVIWRCSCWLSWFFLQVRKWTAADFHNTMLDGGPVHIIRAGLANVSGLYSKLSVKEIVEEMTLKKEELWIMCDRVTRETGRLTKQIVIMDFANQGSHEKQLWSCFEQTNVSGWFYPSQALIQSQNDASAIAKLLYPQLLDKGKQKTKYELLLFRFVTVFHCQVIILNAPWFFKQLWKIATMVLSESLTSKVGMCGGTIVPGELGKCPWASKHLAVEDMPTFVGGDRYDCSCGFEF